MDCGHQFSRAILAKLGRSERAFDGVGFTLTNVVPWGRSFDEYRRMFRLNEPELRLKIVGCADGPASFNAEMTERGYSVVSCDPLYQFSTPQIQTRIDAAYETIMAQTLNNRDLFVWKVITSPEELGHLRRKAMSEFLADYKSGNGRYVAAELPALPFATGSFDLAVCSHFLFLYSSDLSLDFHQRSIEDMCRVAKEVRIFPLLTNNAEPSPFVAPLVENLQKAGRSVSIDTVPYEFRRGFNQMLRIA